MKIEEMSTSELDRFIAEAVRARAERNEPMADAPPETNLVTHDPAWRGQATEGMLTMFFRGAGIGWAAFSFNKPQIAAIYGFLSHVLMAGNMETSARTPSGENVSPTPAAPTYGGSRIH